MPTLTQVRNEVDSRLAALWSTTIVPRQEQYFENNGTYWQGLATSLNIPNSTGSALSEQIPDRLGITPTDVDEDWNVIYPELNIPLPYVLVMDVYEGPQGNGFVASIWLRYNGTIYTRSQNYGPYTELTEPWSVFTPEQEV